MKFFNQLKILNYVLDDADRHVLSHAMARRATQVHVRFPGGRQFLELLHRRTRVEAWTTLSPSRTTSI